MRQYWQECTVISASKCDVKQFRLLQEPDAICFSNVYPSVAGGCNLLFSGNPGMHEFSTEICGTYDSSPKHRGRIYIPKAYIYIPERGVWQLESLQESVDTSASRLYFLYKVRTLFLHIIEPEDHYTNPLIKMGDRPMINMDLRGLTAAPITLFTPNGRIDFDAIQRLGSWLGSIDGVKGLVVLDHIGEEHS